MQNDRNAGILFEKQNMNKYYSNDIHTRTDEKHLPSWLR